MQGLFMQVMRDDDDGDNGVQRRDFVGDEQHAEANKAGDNDPQRSIEFCQEDSCPQLLYAD